jgi:hypothetical protein
MSFRRASLFGACIVSCPAYSLASPRRSVFDASRRTTPLLESVIRGGSQMPDPFPQHRYDNYPLLATDNDDDPYHQTVQERVDTWRYAQRQQAAAAQESPRDEQGRMKLLTSVSKGSRAIIFFILMWRNIHLYEVADQNYKGMLRLFAVVPLIGLFLANLAGIVSSLASPSHSTKKRLKAILNLDKLLEISLITFYFVRLTFWPSAYTPREMYIACTFHSIFFILQCQAFTRVSWDEASAPTVDGYAKHAAAHGSLNTNNDNDINMGSTNRYYDPANRHHPSSPPLDDQHEGWHDPGSRSSLGHQ